MTAERSPRDTDEPVKGYVVPLLNENDTTMVRRRPHVVIAASSAMAPTGIDAGQARLRALDESVKGWVTNRQCSGVPSLCYN